MTRSSVVVLLVGLLAVAGLTTAGVSIPQRHAVTTSPSAPSQSTPPPETSTGTTSDGTVFPPGASASGIDNATRLLEAHRSALSDRTYSVRLNATRATETTNPNGTFVGFDVTRFSISVDEGSNATLVTFADQNATYEGANASVSYWVTEEAVATRNVDGSVESNRVLYVYETTGGDAGLVEQSVSGGLSEPSVFLRPYLRAFEYEHAGTLARDGRTLHRFASTELNETAARENADIPASVARVNATLLVDERGVIRSFDASAVRSRENRTVTTGVSYALPRIGNVTPTPPDWFVTELPHLDASLSRNGTVVAINHTGGASVSTPGLLLYSPSGSAQGEVAGTFDPGETLYLHLSRDDPSRIVVTRDEPPAVNDSFVQLGGENVSVSASKWATGGTSRVPVTIEVSVEDNASNVSLPTATAGPNATDGAHPTLDSDPDVRGGEYRPLGPTVDPHEPSSTASSEGHRRVPAG